MSAYFTALMESDKKFIVEECLRNSDRADALEKENAMLKKEVKQLEIYKELCSDVAREYHEPLILDGVAAIRGRVAALKKENIFVPYASLRAYAARPKGRLIGLAFDGYKWCSPAVLRTDNWEQRLIAFRRWAPDKDMTPDVQALIRLDVP